MRYTFIFHPNEMHKFYNPVIDRLPFTVIFPWFTEKFIILPKKRNTANEYQYRFVSVIKIQNEQRYHYRSNKRHG